MSVKMSSIASRAVQPRDLGQGPFQSVTASEKKGYTRNILGIRNFGTAVPVSLIMPHQQP
jgi:hypothetical protein